ncbi:hypothetical protein EDD21DRAFT_443528 [Dissophora ornata]|nr:hypothetical protein BGZ58_006923 [Dissophora ornata]KAI8601647.1 hypothetical protein EDD21DRAFT_443528 [Dissophora ornata]
MDSDAPTIQTNAANTDAQPPCQSFRASDREQLVRIPAMRHPDTGEFYVIWTDITDCFPRIVRIQHGDLYVPLMRDQGLYRVRPHGIKYHPGEVLDVVYGDESVQQHRMLRHRAAKKGKSSVKYSHSLGGSISGGSSQMQSPDLTVNGTSSGSVKNGRRNEDVNRELEDSSSIGSSYVSSGFSSPHSTILSEQGVSVDSENRSKDGKDRQSEEHRQKDEGKQGEVRKEVKAQEIVEAKEKSNLKAGDANAKEGSVSNGKGEDDPVLASHLKGVVDQEDAAHIRHIYKELAVHAPPKVTDQSSSRPRRLPEGQHNSLTVADVVRKRIGDVLRKRYHWIESSSPKLFVLLPASYTTSTKTEADFDNTYLNVLNWADFAIHFLCDCGGVSGFKKLCHPHWNLKDCPWGHPTASGTERSIIEKFGPYIMGILEMSQHGVMFEGEDTHLTVPAESDPELQKRITLAIKYLRHKGLTTSEHLLSIISGYEDSALDYIPPITPLTKKAMAQMKTYFYSDSRQAIEDTHLYLTPDRDVRWVCLAHCLSLSPSAEWSAALKFSYDPASTATEFRTSMGAFRSVITTKERARVFYQLAEKLTSTCILRVFLDWDLTADDEEELRVAASKFPAVFVRIQLRAASTRSGVSGFGHGYSPIIFEALKNKNIEAFVMDIGTKDEPSFYGYDERFDVKRSFSSEDGLVRYKKSVKTGKMNLRIMVTDIDKGALKVRSVFKGLHNFTKLSLIMSDIWEYVTIKFLKPGQPGYEIEDTDYMSGDPLAFFEKRGNQDSVKYNCQVMADNRFIHSKVLTSMNIGFVYARDRNKVREVLKNNKRLQRVDLENLVQDDPSQIFESFKALLINHPTLQSLEIKQRHTGAPSDFHWRDVSDPAKMRVTITTYEGDKVASIFQKYATSLRSIHICGITVQDAAVLEKSLRPKKGPFKLENLWIFNVHLIDPAALDDLKKIILRGDIAKVRVSGDVTVTHSDKDSDPAEGGSSSNKSNIKKLAEHLVKKRMEEKAAAKTVEFCMSIRTKVTELSVSSNSSQRIIEALEQRRPQASILPMLSGLLVSGVRKRIIDHKWLTEILCYKSTVIRGLLEDCMADSPNGIKPSTSHKKQGGDGKTKEATGDDAFTSAAAAAAAGSIDALASGPAATAAYTVCPATVKPLDNISLRDFEVQAEDWEFLLRVLDFRYIKRFRLDTASEMTGEMLMRLVEAIPNACPLESISISAPGPTPDESLLCQRAISMKAKPLDGHLTVLVNGYIG